MKKMKCTYQYVLKYSTLIILTLLYRPNDSHARMQNVGGCNATSGSGSAEEALWTDRRPEQRAAPGTYEGALSVLFANDYFAGNDNRYTSGLGLFWTSPDINVFGPDHLYRKIGNLLSFIPTVSRPDYKTYLQSSLGMEIYTAKDITVTDPPTGDHPYAGIVYWDNSIISIGRRSSHQFGLRMGWVGPASGAESVQTRFHEIIDSPEPRGWHTQLENEPILNLFYQYGRRLLRNAPSGHFGYDVTASGGGGLGNYYMGANIGLTLRIGCNLPNTYGSMPIIGEATPIAGLSHAGNGISFYAFLEPQFFGVSRWLPTDGNTFVDSRSGDRDRWFANMSVGFLVGYGRVALSFTYHNITGATCFKNAVSGNQDSYGTLILTVFLG